MNSVFNKLSSIKTTVIIYLLAAWVCILQFLAKLKFYKASRSKVHFKEKSFAKKVAVVTGGSSGIGLSTVKKLIQHNFFVISIAREHPFQLYENGADQKHVKTYSVDLSDFESLQQVIEDIKSHHEAIDVLINCAGIMFHGYQTNDHQIEQHFAVNYLSHFILTNKLLPLLKKSKFDKPTIINLTSSTYAANSLSFSERNFKVHPSDYCRYHWYSASKHAMLLFSMSLRSILNSEGCTLLKVVAYDPGTVKSNLFQYSDFLSRLVVKYFGGIFLRSPRQAADDIMHIIYSQDAKVLYSAWKQGYFDLADQSHLSSKLQSDLYKTSVTLMQSILVHSLY